MLSMRRALLLVIPLLLLSQVAWPEQALELQTRSPIGQTGDYLLGMHFVYSDEEDSIYKDQSVARWARQAGMRVARYPGGTVIKYWDWKEPSGIIDVDTWEPGPDPQAPDTEWMSLDEYLQFVRVSGVKPLLGVNLLSGVRYDRVNDSVQRAADMVKYVVSKGYRGAFYYLGNEDMAPMGGVEGAARIFVEHAQAIKAVDPSAKLFWNDNSVNPKRLRLFLDIAGKYADGVEFHGKWPYGDGQKFKQVITVKDWQEQYPFGGAKRGSYSQRGWMLRNEVQALGYPQLMIANNEYGLAQFKEDRFSGFTRFHFALVTLEYLQDLFVGQYDMAAFWSNVAAEKGGGGNRDEKRLINKQYGNRLNPVHYGFEMLASAQGKPLFLLNGANPAASGFAVRDENRMEVFMLNKTSQDNPLTLSLDKAVRSAQASTLVDTPDHWGRVVQTSVSHKENQISIELPALSYSRLILELAQ